MANISLTLYTNGFFGSVLKSPIQIGTLSVNNSVTNISRLGTFKQWNMHTLQRQFRLYIPFLGIARPQPQYPHSCVCERFIYSQDLSTYFLQQKRQTHRGNI